MWFKVAFASAFLFAVTVAAKTARLAARRHGGAINQISHEVRGLLFLRAALGIVFYAALAAWMFWPRSSNWMYLPIPMMLRWTAAGLLLPTLGFFAASFHALGANYRGGVGLYAAHSLVTTGPYHYIRHPIYVAFIAIMGLVLLLSANWVLGLSGLLLVASIAVVRIPVEERQLHEHFGTAWEAYCTRTGSIFPRIRRHQ
jgi:protein-S-isoprenylcysteine O-methyltransferase Ste14